MQFNAWEVDRYTEASEAQITYTFSFIDPERDDYTFTINIERQESETEAYEITTVEEMIDVYYDVENPFYVDVDWMEDRDVLEIMAPEGDELGLLFFSERSDLEIEVEFDDGNMLIYSTGTFANAIEMDGFFYWYRSYAVEYDVEETSAQIRFRIKGMSFGSSLDLAYYVNFELDDWNSDDYFENLSDFDAEEDYSTYEYGISNYVTLTEVADEMDLFYVLNVDEVEADVELSLYPDSGQIVGVLFYSQLSDLELDFTEDYLEDAEDKRLFPTDDFAWNLEDSTVHYWFTSYAVST